MGQYHLTVNLDKHEFIDPQQLGDGLKLVEQCGWLPGGVNDALHLLLAVSNGRGGGDFQESEWVGRWGGDRIAVVGDYGEDGDLAPEHKAGSIYSRCRCSDEPDEEGERPEGPKFRDITPALLPTLEEAFEVVCSGDGWRDRIQLSRIEGWNCSHGRPGQRMASIGGSGGFAAIGARDYPIAVIAAAVRFWAKGKRARNMEKLPWAELEVIVKGLTA